MQRIIVAHKTPDLDAITSMWLLQRFLPGWEGAELKFVLAGSKLEGEYDKTGDAVEILKDKTEIIHVDTGLGKLDHHQLQDEDTCAAKLTFEYVTSQDNNTITSNKHRHEAIRRMVELAVDVDHFQEVYYPNPVADQYDFSLVTVLDGYRMQHPGEDTAMARFGMGLLDAVLHEMENKMWAEEEIKEKGVEFTSRWGKAMGVETQNDEILKLGQRMGYVVTVRKDPKYGTIRIKARPKKRVRSSEFVVRSSDFEEVEVDFTQVYEKLKAMDPDANWYLHVSKRMLLNGSTKNPEMKGSKISLQEVIELLR